MDSRLEDYNNIHDLNSLMAFMSKYIEYGYVDVNNNVHVNELKNVRSLYRTRDIFTTITTGLGTCVEQSRLIKERLSMLGYETKLFCSLSANDENIISGNDARMHSFVLAFKDDKCVYFEYPNYARRGIHVFDTEDEALSFIKGFYSNNSIYKLYQIDDIPIGLSFNELLEYVKSFDLVNGFRKK